MIAATLVLAFMWAPEAAVPLAAAVLSGSSSSASTTRTRSRAWPCCSRRRSLSRSPRRPAEQERGRRRRARRRVAAGAGSPRALKPTRWRHATSGRSRLISVTARVIRNHPLVGVGVGSQPLASHNEVKTQLVARKDASHTTPLTVLAELGDRRLRRLRRAPRASAVRLLRRVVRERDRAARLLASRRASSSCSCTRSSTAASSRTRSPGACSPSPPPVSQRPASRATQVPPEVREQLRDDRQLRAAAEVDRPCGEHLGAPRGVCSRSSRPTCPSRTVSFDLREHSVSGRRGRP